MLVHGGLTRVEARIEVRQRCVAGVEGHVLGMCACVLERSCEAGVDMVWSASMSVIHNLPAQSRRIAWSGFSRRHSYLPAQSPETRLATARRGRPWTPPSARSASPSPAAGSALHTGFRGAGAECALGRGGKVVFSSSSKWLGWGWRWWGPENSQVQNGSMRIL
eukprot:57612-Chlamydomonas_euryale.AAC.1